MIESGKAVFLSYAREDAGAARRIAEALRAAGVEVWFDESELRGGDAWDAKIRRQIDACTLFLPIISRHTQERGKGYFRLEWRLAVEQTHLMAEGIAFLAPVVIDDTPETGALVPAEFLRVQWTRLPDALPSPQFVTQIKRLLDPQASAAASRQSAANPAAAAGPAAPPAARPVVPWLVGGLVLLAIVVVGLLVWRRPAAAAPEVTKTEAAPRPATPAPVAPAAKSIAVLPFANMSEDKDNSAFFADGVHEDVLTNLAFIRDLRVVSRTSVAQYRNTTKPISEIARELNVAYVLEGSVRRSGNKVRVTGQLIRAATDEHVWAKSYDRDATDVFAIQGELAQAIAAALQSVIAPETKALLERRPTDNPAAYDAYLKARRLAQQEGLYEDEIIGRLQEAVQLDPNYAAAWGFLASRHAFAYFNRDRSEARLAQAKIAIETAVHLAPEDPLVIEGQGDYYYYAFRDYARARAQFEKLAQLRPNDGRVFGSLAFICRRQGRMEEAIGNFRRALQLDPDNTQLTSELAQTLFACRRYAEAITLAQDRLAQRPDLLWLRATMVQSQYALRGDPAPLQEYARLKVKGEDVATHHYLRLVNARIQGDWAEAIRLEREVRYYEADVDTPLWLQDALSACTLGEAGDLVAARARAAEAIVVMKAELARQPLSPLLWVSLGLCHGLLGEKAETIQSVAKAREILPESADAVQGRLVSGLGASALAWAGETETALAEFQRLLRVPYGTAGVVDRGLSGASWKRLRDDPRFQALLADPKNNQPLL